MEVGGFTCTNMMIARFAWPVNKELKRIDMEGCLSPLSTLDDTIRFLFCFLCRHISPP